MTVPGVPRTLRSPTSASTRVFDALWRCAADPGSIVLREEWVPALRCTAEEALQASGTRYSAGGCQLPARRRVRMAALVNDAAASPAVSM
ncbi:hypothetical protein SAMN05443247_09176 [Bradyrhizobium erythrophlei]|jgi:hypothetical protein|nr:hypothetical protein SAMN05443247_09176 [Bradyrhizobium erythrophlei]